MIFSHDKHVKKEGWWKGKEKGDTVTVTITPPTSLCHLWCGRMPWVHFSVGFILWFTLPVLKLRDSSHELSHSSKPRWYLLGQWTGNMKKTRAIKPRPGLISLLSWLMKLTVSFQTNSDFYLSYLSHCDSRFPAHPLNSSCLIQNLVPEVVCCHNRT